MYNTGFDWKDTQSVRLKKYTIKNYKGDVKKMNVCCNLI